ncbi:hypothetical protein [Altererythrobacter sp. Root672]|uniref:hypothetical protein n=1 Tax=Altererythrobacter sp. Root672 TaxID=1736584 RepID=UPI0006F2F888|nr:hypothetical protein [Altererythrobacter sp. Root672]KRA80689.1 hypothetical protein ASD76_16240 [Altererythrobacter sp. Root672]
MGLATAFSSFLLATAAPASPACLPVEGWDEVLADDQVRWIVIGEVHGSNEVPALFADVVCLTAQSRPVVVAVEQPASDQAAIDAFITSDGGAEAEHKFLSAVMWNMPMKDGRSSEAYFRLFETLRQMRAAGRISSVIAFQPTAFTARPTPAEYEKAMADLVRSAAQGGATVLALVGNVHAQRTEVPRGTPYMAMAGNLPAEATVTFNTRGEGGETWACIGDPNGAPGKIDCGAHTAGPVLGRAREVELSSDPAGPYTGVIYLGAPTSASLPKVAGPSQPSVATALNP